MNTGTDGIQFTPEQHEEFQRDPATFARRYFGMDLSSQEEMTVRQWAFNGLPLGPNEARQVLRGRPLERE